MNDRLSMSCIGWTMNSAGLLLLIRSLFPVLLSMSQLPKFNGHPHHVRPDAPADDPDVMDHAVAGHEGQDS